MANTPGLEDCDVINGDVVYVQPSITSKFSAQYIYGSLTVNAYTVSAALFPNLKLINGVLKVTGSVNMPSLQCVGKKGDNGVVSASSAVLDIGNGKGNPGVTVIGNVYASQQSIDLTNANLLAVQGQISVSQGNMLQNQIVTFKSLKYLQDNISFFQGGGPHTIAFPALEYIGGVTYRQANLPIPIMSFPVLKSMDQTETFGLVSDVTNSFALFTFNGKNLGLTGKQYTCLDKSPGNKIAAYCVPYTGYTPVNDCMPFGPGSGGSGGGNTTPDGVFSAKNLVIGGVVVVILAASFFAYRHYTRAPLTSINDDGLLDAGMPNVPVHYEQL